MFRMLRLNPPHGWNAVAWELIIVTAGVLIALAAQQWVEERGWHDRVAHADAAIREELQTASGNARERVAMNDCMAGKLDEIEKLLLTTSGQFVRPPYVSRYWSITRLWPTDAWETDKNNDVIAHMPPDRAGAYASIYTDLVQIREEEALEQQHVADLAILPHFVGRMSDMTRDRLLSAVTRSRRDNDLVVRDSGQIVVLIHELGVTDPPDSLLPTCNSLQEPMPS